MKLGKKYFTIVLLTVLAVGVQFSCHAEESIWSGLVLASKSENPAAVPPELKDFTKQLENIFGYNQFELLGQHTELIGNPSEHWLIPSEDFSLLVNCKKATRPGYNYRLKLALFQDKKLLAEMESRLGGENLLFIRGPFYGDGQLLIIVVVK